MYFVRTPIDNVYFDNIFINRCRSKIIKCKLNLKIKMHFVYETQFVN